jgi:hypothetical protein
LHALENPFLRLINRVLRSKQQQVRVCILRLMQGQQMQT